LSLVCGVGCADAQRDRGLGPDFDEVGHIFSSVSGHAWTVESWISGTLFPEATPIDFVCRVTASPHSVDPKAPVGRVIATVLDRETKTKITSIDTDLKLTKSARRFGRILARDQNGMGTIVTLKTGQAWESRIEDAFRTDARKPNYIKLIQGKYLLVIEVILENEENVVVEPKPFEVVRGLVH